MRLVLVGAGWLVSLVFFFFCLSYTQVDFMPGKRQACGRWRLLGYAIGDLDTVTYELLHGSRGE